MHDPHNPFLFRNIIWYILTTYSYLLLVLWRSATLEVTLELRFLACLLSIIFFFGLEGKGDHQDRMDSTSEA
jgi:hypothetical protein